MAKNSATLVVDKFSKVVKNLSLMSSDVLVGVPHEGANRKETGPMNNATIAYIQDNGSPAANIPARPFMRPGIKAVQPKVVEALRAGALAALHGEATGVDRALNVAGLTAQSSIRGTINAGIAPPLAARTLAARRARGRTGEKPLVDTGQLRNSINYIVRKP